MNTRFFIATFDNGQVMLLELLESEMELVATKIREKMEGAAKWAETRFASTVIDAPDRPDPIYYTRFGVILDCSHVIAFGPYVELPSTSGKEEK